MLPLRRWDDSRAAPCPQGRPGREEEGVAVQPRWSRLSLAEWVVLCLISEKPTHSFAIASLLAKDGSLGQVWHVQKAVAYRAAARLVQLGLITAAEKQPSNLGPARSQHPRESNVRSSSRLLMRLRRRCVAQPDLTTRWPYGGTSRFRQPSGFSTAFWPQCLHGSRCAERGDTCCISTRTSGQPAPSARPAQRLGGYS